MKLLRGGNHHIPSHRQRRCMQGTAMKAKAQGLMEAHGGEGHLDVGDGVAERGGAADADDDGVRGPADEDLGWGARGFNL